MTKHTLTKAVILTVFVLFALVGPLPSLSSAQTPNIGIRKIPLKVADVNLSLLMFYPTSEPSKPTKFGPWQVDAVANAEPQSGQYPFVIISHGLGGNDWNHHLLAQRLVKAGFIVGAVRHPDDLMRVGRQEILVLRPMEARAALDKILRDETLGKYVNAQKIGAFGFSQGGLTILRSLGAKAQHQKLIDHCIAKEDEDEEFCTGKSAGFAARVSNLAKKMFYDVPKVGLTDDVTDSRIKYAIVAAPVGAPITDLSAVKTPLWIIRAGKDSVLKYPFHAEYIHHNLKAEHDYTVLEGIDHYAFLSPFPEVIRDEVGIPAKDPKGFDRGRFLEKLNGEIVERFVERLGN